MRRILKVVLMTTMLSGVAFGIYTFTQPCRFVDRLLGLSGCVNSIVVEQFSPINGAAMSPQDRSGEVSLFGHSLQDGQWTPTVVRLDLQTRTELSRTPIDVGEGFGHLIFSADGEKAVLSCLHANQCTRDGQRSAILMVRDGRILQTGLGDDEDYILFPGETQPAAGTGIRLSAADGARIVDIQKDRSLVLRDKAGAEITVLYQGPRQDVLRSGVSVSPSGRYIAMFDRAGEQRAARLMVWDALSGKKLSDRRLGSEYLWRFTPVWVNGESLIALVRQSGTGASVELFRSE